MLTNISKRGRPPKILKEEQNENSNEVSENNDLDIEGIEVDEGSVVSEEVIDEGDENVENIIDIDKDREDNWWILNVFFQSICNIIGFKKDLCLNIRKGYWSF